MKTANILRTGPLKTLGFRLVSLVLFNHLCAFSPCAAPSGTTKATSTASEKAAHSSAQKPVASKTLAKAGAKKTASARRKVRRRLVRGQRTIEPARVVEIQSALAAAGYYRQEPNGQWDDPTSKAMSAYQQENGFKTTGKPDALSLKKLGL